MTLFKKKDKEIFFVHIPRTAGRYITSLFEKNNYELFFWDFDKKVEGIEVPHLHYPHYNNYLNVEGKNHFTVIRNPYSKFRSSINFLQHIHKTSIEEYHKLKNTQHLFDVLNNLRSNLCYYNNWYRPQNEFISDKTHIWRYENGFKNNFVEWINDTFDLDLKRYDDLEYELEDGEKREYIIDDDKKIESNIRKYYSKDYEFFNY